jgi:hypothetical protein
MILMFDLTWEQLLYLTPKGSNTSSHFALVRTFVRTHSKQGLYSKVDL